MRRGDFEALVRRHLDTTLNPRGFTMTPQAPPDWEDEEPLAVYEADPRDYGLRYPLLRARFDGDVSCIDIWIRASASGQLICEVEGENLADLIGEVGAAGNALNAEPAGDNGAQLDAIAAKLRTVLDWHASSA